MSLGIIHQLPVTPIKSPLHFKASYGGLHLLEHRNMSSSIHRPQLSLIWKRKSTTSKSRVMTVSAAIQPLDLTEDNVKKVLHDARAELGQIFDGSVGITGVVELVDLDGPYVTISLKGRFWHKRSHVVERLANYLKQRIPEILEVDIEDEKQLDDSPANF